MSIIKPNWSIPNNVEALYTTRSEGVSQKPWDGFNLATHVDDQVNDVLKNRAILLEKAKLAHEPEWLNQTHSIDVAQLDGSKIRDADAAITKQIGQVAVVLTADCLPLLICNQQGNEVAAIHAGWKGMLDGIITKTIKKMQSKPSELTVWLGPAISQKYFEVGDEVRQQFCDAYSNVAQYFIPNKDKYMADLYGLAKEQLQQMGIQSIHGGEFCSFADNDKFYSYRRDGVTGRMASLIWINKK